MALLLQSFFLFFSLSKRVCGINEKENFENGEFELGLNSIFNFPTFCFLIYFYKPKQVTFCSKTKRLWLLFFDLFNTTFVWFTPISVLLFKKNES